MVLAAARCRRVLCVVILFVGPALAAHAADALVLPADNDAAAPDPKDKRTAQGTTPRFFEPDGEVALALTGQEQAWLKEHAVVRFVGDPDWLPYEAIDEKGDYTGIVAEYLRLIEQKLGITFELVPTRTWSESVALARNGEVDMISETYNSGLSAFLDFTVPYLSSPLVIVMKAPAPHIDSIGQISDKRIAIIREYGYLPDIYRKYPDLDYQVVDTVSDGLTAVSTGAVDALFSTLAQASYHIADLGINNVRIVGKTGFDTRLALGVQRELAPLVPLLDRALASISSSARQRILRDWGRQQYSAGPDYRRITLFALIGITALALSLLWNYSIRRQKERLRISEERFQLAMDAASVGLWDWNAVTGKVFYSPLWMSMLGYEPYELPYTFETFCNLLHPDDREKTLANNERMLHDPALKYEHEFRLRTRDGGYRWILSRGHVFSRDSQGRPLRALGTHTDITRRKQAEIEANRLNQDLLAANQRFAMAASAISLGVWERLTDGSNRLVFDERMLEIYGMESRDYVTVHEWLRRVHPDDRKIVTASIRKALREGGDAHADFRVCPGDGSVRHIYAAVTTISGGRNEPAHLIGVNWDITARKMAEEQFRKVVNALPVAVAIADMQGRVILANPQAQREFGGDDPVIGAFTDYFYTKPGQREELLAVLADQGQITAEEVQYRNARGELIEGMLSALPISYNDRPALLGVIINITERRMIERELAQAKEQAEEANRFKGQFLANMSHEIRTPMNAVVGLGHLLSRTPLSPKQQDYLGKIQISAQALLNIIDDILDFSKIEAGELRIETIDFDLNEVLDNIATLAGTRLAEKPIEFVYDIDATVPFRLRGDPYRLTQILTNLVGNAAKFTSEGGIIVRIRVAQSGDPLRLVFAVEDTGMGIAPEKIERLFTAFTQADGSTTREYGGTGLGLSICRQLTELMGGTISAQSTPGKGSRFEFQLPFGAPLTEADATPATPAGGLRVLLVDDNAIARQVLADLLQSLSMRVDVVSSGSAAIKRMQSKGKVYDILLLDWRMPGMDGVETARRIRSAGLSHMPHIIMMTAYGREAVEQIPDMSGIDAFLVKPITPSHLLDAITQTTCPETVTYTQTLHAAGEDRRRLRGKVLLVEDNRINQQVAQELLEQMGLEVTLCDNSTQVLSRIGEVRPDLVLMDIQMPDMDGYEATARIRRMSEVGSLPIIAMTANAMAGDAERSLAAGMNGHITKPVDPRVLYTTLAAWLESTETTGVVANSDEATVSSGVSPGRDAQAEAGGHDQAPGGAIDYENGVMRVGGNRRLYGRLLGDFVVQYRDAVSRVERLCRDREASGLESLLHTLKGVAGNIGAGSLREVAAVLEQRACEGNVRGVEDAVPEFARSLDRAVRAAQNFAVTDPSARQVDEAPVGPVADSDPAALLGRLAELLDEGDADALDQLAGLQAARFGEVARALAQQLDRQVREYDFNLARETLSSLARELGLQDPAGCSG